MATLAATAKALQSKRIMERIPQLLTPKAPLLGQLQLGVLEALEELALLLPPEDEANVGTRNGCLDGCG
jgi:hypothetical protein